MTTSTPRTRTQRITAAAATASAAFALASCASGNENSPITVSGSSTVFPITQAVARDLNVSIDQEATGTLDGFEKFCNGETQINNASEAIPGDGQDTDYVSMCEENGVDFIELPIALDTLSIIRNADNDQVTDLTLDELRTIWEPDSEVASWSDIRPEWPDEDITLVGRNSGSATFDYFTHFVNGTAGEIRDDYEVTDDADEVVEKVAEDPNALGFTGIGNYLGAEDALEQVSTVSVDGVEPSLENAQNGTYSPLTRPLFLYVSTEALNDNEQLESFVAGYLDSVYELLPRVYFYRLPEETYELVRQRFEDRTTGTLFDGNPHSEEDVTELLRG